MTRTFSDLSPTEFENLTYDLLHAAGLGNLVWRTPGADGGRDIEGVSDFVDFTGHAVRHAWYVECKRYTGTVDWPTVWGKISYADNLGADFLLLVTNSSPSPICETHISTWNNNRRRPAVRIWRGYELEQVLRGYPAVAIKYGLRDLVAQPEAQFLPILTEIMKISQASYSAQEFGGNSAPGIETASALAELTSLRMSQIERLGRLVPGPKTDEQPSYPWVDAEGSGRWESAALRAVLCVYRYVVGAERLALKFDTNTITLSPKGARFALTPTTLSTLTTVALWSDVEITNVDTRTSVVTIQSR